ncbi:copper-translocating P-type ATPase [candidate division WWE3 bacterium RBG_19FT_COMBO_53_11]|uniref:Copper-translocating P-type ATPase n=1 Tax=candidate division WWE3 bacterium RBG_19FT_COMBO_53_11 TaxID=1802613 RepID=A0A1F4UJ11_UNCKA|nr:MAG: copper-translocating P-type ATPase [candidate division WWE3 bacterium RBG_19FT_COMBO_53_11]
MFRDRFLLSLILTIPVVFYSDLVQRVFGYTAPTFPYSFLIQPVLSTVVFFYGGLVFLRSAWGELRARLPGMMTLIALAISVAYLYSVSTLIFPLGEPLFWELTTLITIMLLGHWIEMRAVSSASGALRELAKLLPDQAERLNGELLETVLVSELKVGDVVLVRPGAKVPADGVVTEGETSVNESMITGESMPVAKKVGDPVIAGTVNGTGPIRVKVSKIGEDTALAGIMRLVAEAQASRSRIQELADRAAFYLTIVAVSVGAVTVLTWLLAGAGPAFALERAVAVLVIACPHALGLAIPLVTSISTTLSARSGLLVREKLALELARKVDVVLFDKTGTLTSGELGVTDILPVPGWSEEKALQWDASLEAVSEHAIAKGVVKEAQNRRLELLKIAEAKTLPGRGIKGKIGDQVVYAGGPRLLEELKVKVPESLTALVAKLSRQGKTVVYLLVSQKIVAAFGVADLIRPESRQAVPALQKMGIRVAMVTGDAKPVAEWVAKELGMTEYFAEVLPENKVEMVQKLQADGSRVMMVGDGINDAPALTAADVGVAIGAGTDVAIESAGIVLIKNDPRDIVKIIKLAKANYRKMIENLVWATGYNVFAIPAAAGLFSPFGIILAPALAAVLMSASTVIVSANAQLLRRLQL